MRPNNAWPPLPLQLNHKKLDSALMTLLSPVTSPAPTLQLVKPFRIAPLQAPLWPRLWLLIQPSMTILWSLMFTSELPEELLKQQAPPTSPAWFPAQPPICQPLLAQTWLLLLMLISNRLKVVSAMETRWCQFRSASICLQSASSGLLYGQWAKADLTISSLGSHSAQCSRHLLQPGIPPIKLKRTMLQTDSVAFWA